MRGSDKIRLYPCIRTQGPFHTTVVSTCYCLKCVLNVFLVSVVSPVLLNAVSKAGLVHRFFFIFLVCLKRYNVDGSYQHIYGVWSYRSNWFLKLSFVC